MTQRTRETITENDLDELREYIDCTRADIALANHYGHRATAVALSTALDTAENDLREWTAPRITH